MKANELRIGNMLNYQIGSSIMQGIVTSISTGSIVIDHKSTFKTKSESDTYRLMPIFLTEEWLLKFGFEHHSSNVYYWISWGENGIQIIKYSDYYRKYTFELGKGLSKVLDYVHQLQNLYFALTGNELTYK